MRLIVMPAFVLFAITAAAGDLTTITSPEARYLVNLGKTWGETVERLSTGPGGIYDIASAGGNDGYFWQMNDGDEADGSHPNTFGGSYLLGVGDYVGYIFKQPVQVDHVVFTNKVYSDGGTFAAQPKLTYYSGDAIWWDTQASCSPAYQSGFGSAVRTYTFTPAAAPVLADAIRLQGVAAASSSSDSDGFIGVAELTVFGEMVTPRPVAIRSDLTGRVACTASTNGSQFDPANMIDDDLSTFDTTYEAPPDRQWQDRIRVCFDQPQSDITAVGVVFRFFSDGGWFDETSHPFTVEYSPDGGSYFWVSGLDKSTYDLDYEDLAVLSWDVESGYLLTFEPLTEPILCMMLYGDGGGTADPYPGTDTAGFVAITEIEIFQIPDVFSNGFESGDTTGWSSSVP